MPDKTLRLFTGVSRTGKYNAWPSVRTSEFRSQDKWARAPRATQARTSLGQPAACLKGHRKTESAPPTIFFHAQSVDSMATFQELATVINVYKLARYSWEAVEFDEAAFWGERMAKCYDLEEAYAELLWYIDRKDDLPPACRQQLSILFYETQSQEVHRRLEPGYLLNKGHKSSDDSDTDSDDDSRPFAFGDDPFSVLLRPFVGGEQEVDSP